MYCLKLNLILVEELDSCGRGECKMHACEVKQLLRNSREEAVCAKWDMWWCGTFCGP